MARVHTCFDTCVVKFATHSTGNDYGSANNFLTFCNFSISKGLIRSATQLQGHMNSNLEKFLLKSPISATVCLMNLSLVIESNSPLNSQDSPCQTYGCRHRNPHNCAKNSMEDVCAFVTADNICLKPPTGWARQFEKLLKIA